MAFTVKGWITLLKYIKIKYLIILVGVVLALYLVIKLIMPSSAQPSYITATVSKGNIEKTVLADGTISAFKQVSVGAQVSGQIKKLYVALGDEVKRGDMIAEIDDLKQKNDLKQAEASLASLEAQRKSKEANLINNQLTYDRQLKLVNKGVGVQSDLDLAKANLDAIKADIVAQISEADVINVKKGMPVYFTILGRQNDRFGGLTLRAIEPAPDSINTESSSSTSSSSSSSTSAVYYNGLFDVDNPDHILRISMTAQVYIVLAEAKDVLYIPSQAIQKQRADNNAVVYLLNDKGQVEEREVTLGVNNNVNVEITSGLKEGEKVVVSSSNGASVSAKAPRIRF